jgi:ELWxxDGT repeat protein
MKNTIACLLLLLSAPLFSQQLSLVKDINTSGINNSFPRYLTSYNGKMVFVAGDGVGHKLYVSDGTTTGTQLLGPTTNSAGVVWYLRVYKGKLFFTYDDGIHGLELWTSDGTTAGTVMLKDIWTGTNGGGIPYSSAPNFFTECNGLLFFQASTATRNQGLWVTDGTSAGTQMLGNQYSNIFGSISQFIVLNNKIYFQGNAGSGYGMWESDGTTSGTQLVKAGLVGASAGSHAVCNGKFYFMNDDGSNGGELWESNGTSGGTVLVKDIYAGIQSSSPEKLMCHNGKIYFTANDGTHGKELWVSDGTNAGTKMVLDAQSGTGGSNPESMISLNTDLFFFANNGSSSTLFKTDGTVAGTQSLNTMPGIVAVPYVYPFNGKLYYMASNVIGGGATTIFESDGTALGTQQITPMVTSYFDYKDEGFLGYNSNLFLPANFGTQGLEFCKLSLLHTTALNDMPNAMPRLIVFPNPCSNQLNIVQSNFESTSTIEIINSNGQVMQEGIVTGEDITHIDVSSLAPGVYIIEMADEKRWAKMKFVKE